MELRHFRYFIVVAEEQNIMRAAERLHIAQSALSRQMMDLEEQLGVALFERQHRRIHLSEAGRFYFTQIKQVLENIEQINAQTRRYAAGKIGSLSICINNAAVRVPVVTHSLRIFRSVHPGIDLKLTHMYASQQLEALRAGNIDAAFVLHSSDEEETEFGRLEVGKDKYILAIPSSHRLASRRVLRMIDLRDEAFLWKLPGRPPDHVMDACLAAGFTPQISQYVERLEISPKLVAEGMGLAFVLSYTRYMDTEVVFRPVADLDVSLNLDLMWKRTNSSAALAQFVETVRTHQAEIS